MQIALVDQPGVRVEHEVIEVIRKLHAVVADLFRIAGELISRKRKRCEMEIIIEEYRVVGCRKLLEHGNFGFLVFIRTDHVVVVVLHEMGACPVVGILDKLAIGIQGNLMGQPTGIFDRIALCLSFGFGAFARDDIRRGGSGCRSSQVMVNAIALEIHRRHRDASNKVA